MGMSIEKQLLDPARGSKMNMFELSNRSGVPYSAVHGFMTGGRRLSLRSAAKLAKVLKLELRPMRRTKKKAKE